MDVVELDVVDVVVPGRLGDALVPPVVGPVRHDALDPDGHVGGAAEVVVGYRHVAVKGFTITWAVQLCKKVSALEIFYPNDES